MPPALSVIMPVYNGRRYLGEALESVRAQTFEDWEAIVIDDGSTDGSGELVREVAERDRRIHLFAQPNAGLPAARNSGLAHATGALVAFLDADDTWLPTKLARQLDVWREGVLYSDAFILVAGRPLGERIGDHIRFARGQILPQLVVENIVPVLTALLPRELLEAAGGFDESLREGCEDYDLWLRLAEAGVPFDFLDEPLAVYRVHEQAMSSDAVAMCRARWKVFRDAAARSNGDRRALMERRAAGERRDLAGVLRRRAWQEVEAAELQLARGDLLAAHETDPTVVGAIGTALAARSDLVLRALARWRGSSQAREQKPIPPTPAS